MESCQSITTDLEADLVTVEGLDSGSREVGRQFQEIGETGQMLLPPVELLFQDLSGQAFFLPDSIIGILDR